MNRFAAATLILLSSVFNAFADTPTVRFDTDRAVSCKVVSGNTPGAKTKLIEVVLRISAQIDGDEEDVSEVEYEVGQIWEPGYPDLSPWGDYRPEVITDFLPRTKMYSDIAGTKVMIETVENRISGDISGSYTQLSPTGGAANVGGGANASHATTSSMQYEKLPPQQLLVASGTTDRGHAVFYKIKPSPRTTLQGIREFSFILRVPSNWTYGTIAVRCHAEAVKTSFFISKKTVVAGSAIFSVAAYLYGDVNGKILAEKAALRDLARHQVAMGNLYEDDVDGVPRNTAESLKWFELAANEGDADGCLHLGMMYLAGNGVRKDTAEAVKWLCRAGDQGNALANALLGWQYFVDNDVKDHEEAAFRYYASRSALAEMAKNRLKDKVSFKEIVELNNTIADRLTSQLTPAQLSQAQDRAAELLKKTRSGK